MRRYQVNPDMSVSVNPRGRAIGHDGRMSSESWHISERIDRPAAEVYAYASDPANLPSWAPGLGVAVAKVDGQWFVDTPTERVPRVTTTASHANSGIAAILLC
jgi:hypothetical protein